MEVIYGLIPLMIIIGLAMVIIFFWTVKSGQYDDMEGDSNRILMDEDEEMMPDNNEQKKKAVDKRNWPDADAD
jgi:cbb3-type cytochrome oxidase maturation protein